MIVTTYFLFPRYKDYLILTLYYEVGIIITPAQFTEVLTEEQRVTWIT